MATPIIVPGEKKKWVNPFPPPDRPYDKPEPIEVLGAVITSAENAALGVRGIMWTAMVYQDGNAISFRFITDHRNRAVRKFFKALGHKRVPIRTGRWVLDQGGGAFIVNFDAEVWGKDDIPEDSTLSAAYVLQNVKMISLGK